MRNIRYVKVTGITEGAEGFKYRVLSSRIDAHHKPDIEPYEYRKGVRGSAKGLRRVLHDLKITEDNAERRILYATDRLRELYSIPRILEIAGYKRAEQPEIQPAVIDLDSRRAEGA